MNAACVKFSSREDQVRGFYELATRARVTSLPGGIYSIPASALALLDSEGIAYQRATESEVEEANGQIRNPVAVIL